jgi:hypothetical protein
MLDYFSSRTLKLKESDVHVWTNYDVSAVAWKDKKLCADADKYL